MVIPLQREVAFLVVHSMLHLLGYDHEQGGLEAVRMREKGRSRADSAGSAPYGILYGGRGLMRRFLRGFRYAWAGIVAAVRTERNFRFHLCAAAYVLWFSQYYTFTRVEYALLALCIGGVMALELVNSAVERAVDKPDVAHWRAAGSAKDMAAGAVLVFSAAAVVVGPLPFWRLGGTLPDHETLYRQSARSGGSVAFGCVGCSVYSRPKAQRYLRHRNMRAFTGAPGGKQFAGTDFFGICGPGGPSQRGKNPA